MVASANADIGLVEHLAEVVRVNIFEFEAQRGSTDLGVGGAMDGDVVAVALMKCR